MGLLLCPIVIKIKLQFYHMIILNSWVFKLSLFIQIISWAEPSDLEKLFLSTNWPSMFVRRNQHSFLMGIPYALGFLCRWGEVSVGVLKVWNSRHASPQVKEKKKSVKMNFSIVCLLYRAPEELGSAKFLHC